MSDQVSGRVSVIVPAYNHAPYVRECIDSALSQTYPDVEVVVVDDGSTDGTYEILQTYGDRITLIRQENAGTQAARNTAIRASTGEFLALLDSDDMWLPEKLEKQIPLFGDPQVGLVHSLAYSRPENAGYAPEVATIGAPLPDGSDPFESLLLRNTIPALTAVWRRGCPGRSPDCFDETFVGVSDLELWLGIALLWRIVCVPEPLAVYRTHASNTTKRLHDLRLAYAERRGLLEKVRTRNEGRLSTAAWDRVTASAELAGAESAALALDPVECAEYAFRAYCLAPGWVIATGQFDRILAVVAHLREPAEDWLPVISFAETLFAAFSPTDRVIRQVRNAIMGELWLAETIWRDDQRSRLSRLAALVRTLRFEPRYAANGGALSVAGELVFGQRLMSHFRPAARRLLRSMPSRAGTGQGIPESRESV
ncbi:MAG: glycosyltransferase [Anaerolineae bacterium]